jgi:alkylation response protein AidB-like acyl-CoA dehydrogenase
MIDADDLALFESSVRRATETATGDALDAALDELGWRDALAADRRAAVSALFELQGRAAATSSALDWLLTAVLAAEGSDSTAVVLPSLNRVDAPGRSVRDGLAIRGLTTAAVERSEHVLVALADDEGVARVASEDLERRPVRGIDPAFGLSEVSASEIGATTVAIRCTWAEAVALGQLALAHELVGASRAMLALARDHAVERIQFGQPIAQFQAVRHRLADTYVGIESAEAAVVAAWDDGSPLAAAVAKAIAGRSARLVARHCQQVLAGIGFTAEHPLHRYVRRVLVLDGLLGDARSLTRAMGEELLRTRQVPSLLPL